MWIGALLTKHFFILGVLEWGATLRLRHGCVHATVASLCGETVRTGVGLHRRNTEIGIYFPLKLTDISRTLTVK